MTALPFVFLTNQLHALPLATLQNGPPPGIKITKHFLKSHVDDIHKEFLAVKSLGSATVEEWLKGLDVRGVNRRNDGSRWERWEASGGVNRMRVSESQIPHKTIKPTQDITSTASTQGLTHILPVTGANVPVKLEPIRQTAQMPKKVHQLPLPVHTAYCKTIGSLDVVPDNSSYVIANISLCSYQPATTL